MHFDSMRNDLRHVVQTPFYEARLVFNHFYSLSYSDIVWWPQISLSAVNLSVLALNVGHLIFLPFLYFVGGLFLFACTTNIVIIQSLLSLTNN